MSEPNYFPSPSGSDLRTAFVGKTLHDAPLPSAVLDISKIKHNCQLMLDAVQELNLGFRAHVKTHKTSELTRLQVGENCKDVRLIVSTVIEAESLVPLCKDYQARGAKVNILYGIPLGPFRIARLAAVAKELGPGSVAAMIDHPSQLQGVKHFKQRVGFPICVFIKADSGYHRAGLPPTSDAMIELVRAVDQAESQGDLDLLGFYSHNSLSYNGNNPDDAMEMLKFEIETCKQAAANLSSTSTDARSKPLVISVGASPTALSIQNLKTSTQPPPSTPPTTKETQASQALHSTLNLPSPDEFTLEIHAGVYPIFDLQQVAASSRTFPSALAAHTQQALTILAEVASVYPTRTSEPEALISAGTLALAREPCKSYPGWGVVTAWGLESGGYVEEDSVKASTRMIVKRSSQEHGVVGWESAERKEALPLKVGDRVRVWVNHACIASAGFGWYLIVDESDGNGDREGQVVVKDVWVRWRGW